MCAQIIASPQKYEACGWVSGLHVYYPSMLYCTSCKRIFAAAGPLDEQTCLKHTRPLMTGCNIWSCCGQPEESAGCVATLHPDSALWRMTGSHIQPFVRFKPARTKLTEGWAFRLPHPPPRASLTLVSRLSGGSGPPDRKSTVDNSPRTPFVYGLLDNQRLC